MRSMSFTEYEMTSHPIIFLSVVASTDVDHAGCMQELSSPHYVPSCFSTVWLLLSDFSSIYRDSMILKSIECIYFFTTFLQLLMWILDLFYDYLKQNSLQVIQNCYALILCLHQPQICSILIFGVGGKFLCFSLNTPLRMTQFLKGTSSRTFFSHLVRERVVYGSRLSMEDYMSLRTFCLELFQQVLFPTLSL